MNATSSGALAVGTTVVQAKPSDLCSVILSPAATVATVTIFDNATAASGRILATMQAAANGAAATIDFSHPLVGLNGLTVVVTGAGATANIGYVRSF